MNVGLYSWFHFASNQTNAASNVDMIGALRKYRASYSRFHPTMRTCYECRTDRVVSRAVLPPSLKNFHCAIKSGHDICCLRGAKAGIDRLFWGLYKGADQNRGTTAFPISLKS